jgi:hypothetical protein
MGRSLHRYLPRWLAPRRCRRSLACTSLACTSLVRSSLLPTSRLLLAATSTTLEALFT